MEKKVLVQEPDKGITANSLSLYYYKNNYLLKN